MTVFILNTLNFMCNWLKKLFGSKGAFNHAGHCGHCDHCSGHCADKKSTDGAQVGETNPSAQADNIEK